jgi:Protein of unknown function (DUF3108)
VTAVLALLLLAASLQKPAPIEQMFLKGETLDYNLAWLRITAGSARMTIAPVGEEHDRFRITSAARSNPGFSRIFHLRDEIETIVARSDFSTLRYVKRLDERGDKAEEVTTIEGGIARRVRNKVKEVEVPRPVLDPISVIYYVRTIDLSAASAHELTLIADGKVYTVHPHVIRRETIETPAGKFATVMIEPEMVVAGGVPRKERIFVWYSDDERRLPVRIRTEIKVGAITATLRSFRTGVLSTEPSESDEKGPGTD